MAMKNIEDIVVSQERESSPGWLRPIAVEEI
jgi:hypothetical protein